MEGIILLYNNLSQTDIVNINYKLFGRVAKVKNKTKTGLYYYPGLLENNFIYKLANGCYFIKGRFNVTDNRIISINATVNISHNSLYTPKQYFKESFKAEMVNNLE